MTRNAIPTVTRRWRLYCVWIQISLACSTEPRRENFRITGKTIVFVGIETNLSVSRRKYVGTHFTVPQLGWTGIMDMGRATTKLIQNPLGGRKENI